MAFVEGMWNLEYRLIQGGATMQLIFSALIKHNIVKKDQEHEWKLTVVSNAVEQHGSFLCGPLSLGALWCICNNVGMHYTEESIVSDLEKYFCESVRLG